MAQAIDTQDFRTARYGAAGMAPVAGIAAPATDPLTGTWSRRVGLTLLAQRLAQAGRRGAGAALLLIDIDRFASINQRFGAMGGDVLLAEVARRLGAVAQRDDLLFRHGGNRFALLAAAAPAAAAALAERVRARIGDRPVSMAGEPVQVSVSIGLARAPAIGALAPARLLAGAEAALRAAKAGGRDCVRCCELPAATPACAAAAA